MAATSRYVDAYFAEDADGRRLSTGSVITLHGGHIALASKHQSTVATKTA